MTKNNTPRKFLTFSYDDGIAQDIRLINMLEKYGMRGTFHVCSGHSDNSTASLQEIIRTGSGRIPSSEIESVYRGHEVSAHTRTHTRLRELSDSEIINEVEDDRIRLSELVGYDVAGLAYPFGVRDERVLRLLRERTGLRYARISRPSGALDYTGDLLEFPPSARHCTDEQWNELFALGEKFIEAKPEHDIHFCVMGHSYEFDRHGTWDKFEDFLKMMSGHRDVTYTTISEALGLRSTL